MEENSWSFVYSDTQGFTIDCGVHSPVGSHYTLIGYNRTVEECEKFIEFVQKYFFKDYNFGFGSPSTYPPTYQIKMLYELVFNGFSKFRIKKAFKREDLGTDIRRLR